MKLGIIGAGQLAQMIAQSIKPLGIDCIAISDTKGAPAQSDATVWVATDETIEALITDLALKTDCITFDYEHVPEAWLKLLDKQSAVLPSVSILRVTKDRALEKTLSQSLGIAVGPFKMIRQACDVVSAYQAIGPDVIIKSCQGGYDGKHQWRIHSMQDCENFLKEIEHFDHIMESFVPFVCEISLCAVRNKEGHILFYPLFRNTHHDGMLHQTICPDLEFSSTSVEKQAQASMRCFLEAVNYVGVCTIEFFVMPTHEVWLNEIAPRVHNSGHHTIESCQTSQFENHARSVLGLPLGSTDLITPCVMQNIIGEMPCLASLLQNPKAHVHVYGKEPRKARKLGHVTYVQDPLA